jgi:hypothetical protein
MYFIFVPFGGYTLTPALSGWTFEPTTRNVDVNFANSSVTDQDFDGTEDSGGAGPAQAGFVTSLAFIHTRAGTAQISFGLTANASVTAEVLNIAGRRVRLIATDQPMDAGIGTLLWDGRNSSGAVVPSGAYIVRLTARGASGTQSQAMARVNISR